MCFLLHTHLCLPLADCVRLEGYLWVRLLSNSHFPSAERTQPVRSPCPVDSGTAAAGQRPLDGGPGMAAPRRRDPGHCRCEGAICRPQPPPASPGAAQRRLQELPLPSFFPSLPRLSAALRGSRRTPGSGSLMGLLSPRAGLSWTLMNNLINGERENNFPQMFKKTPYQIKLYDVEI